MIARYSPFRHMRDVVWKGRPIHLTFFVTRRCNSNCPFCFYLKSNDSHASERPELSITEIEKISSSLGDLLWLAFSGGEIFLREDLTGIAKTFYRNNRPAIMLFPTNGLLPDLIRERTEEILKACPRSTIALKLSVDGLGEAHDVLRGTHGSFEKTLRTYSVVSELLGKYPNFELGINTVFCAENQDAMDDIISSVGKMEHVRTHTISLVRGDLSDKRYADRVDMAKYQAAVRKLEGNLKEGRSPFYRFRGGRIKAAQDILQRRLIHRTMHERKRTVPCYAGGTSLVLNEAGEVFPCELLMESLGNVRDHGYDLRKVARFARAHKVTDAIRGKKCFCTHECNWMINILLNPRMYPALLKEYVRLGQR